MDNYCNFCGKDKVVLLETNDGKSICVKCADKFELCETCGSTLKEGEIKEEQRHYEEECFR